MPSWRCPHCGTPQAETSRCWVCKRSSTSCATCRHFRRAIAGHLGYCGLDARRLPLRGDELRGCWTAPAAAHAHTPSSTPVLGRGAPATSGERRRLEFVPVEATAPRRRRSAQPRAAARRGPERAEPAAAELNPNGGFWADDV
ncbi:MAG: hypothetical protein ACJ77B_11685 [Chloroflexota bacterium]